MKKKRNLILLIILLLILATIFFLNNRKQPDTIEGLPSQVSKFLTEEDINTLEDLDFPIYFGNNPPNIEGVYITDTLRIDSDEHLPIDTKIKSSENNFYNQTENFEITVDSKTDDQERKGNVGYISGEDNCFTVFDISKTAKPYRCVVTQANIVSGCLDVNGNILDYKLSIMMLKHNNKLSCVIIPKALNEHRPIYTGDIRIISERDGLAERKE
jgi:hypothetical protein